MGLIARNTAALLGGAALMVMIGSAVAGAQQVTPNAQPGAQQPVGEAAKKGRVTLLQRLVIGAGVDKIAIDTPQAVTVVDQEQMDQDQPTTIGDTLRDVPGVTAIGSDRIFGEAFNIRGIGGAAAADESKIIINVDGTPKFYEQYRMGSFFSDPELYKQVEVLRGPASSTLYGSGALGGVINLTTKDAADFLVNGQNNSVRVKSAYDSNGTGILGSTIYATRLNENFEFLGMGNYRQGDDYKDGDGDTIQGSNFESWSGLAKGTYRFGDGNEQTIRLSYQRWQGSGDDQAYSQTDNFDFGTVDRKVTDQTAVFSYENPASDNPWLNLKFELSYSDTANEQTNASGIGMPDQLFDDSDYSYQTLQARLENTFEYKADDFENYLTIGTQISRQDRDAESLGGIKPGPILFHPEGTENKYGFYAQDEFVWREKLTLIPGIRYDYRDTSPGEGIASAEDTSDDAISPKLAALYKFNDSFSVFGSVAHTERFPTIDEFYSTSGPGRGTYPGGRTASLDLEKETSNNYEAGFSVAGYDLMRAGDTLQLKTTGFYNQIRNLISTNPNNRSRLPVTYYVNIAEAKIYGVEVEGSYDAEVFFTRLAYSNIKGEDEQTGAPLTTIPAQQLTMTVGGRMVDYGVEYGWRGQFAAHTDTGFTGQPTPGYGVHDIFTSWKPADGKYAGFEARFAVENIFDRQYRENLSGTDAKGRTFKLTLAKQFGW
ncbi:TonB-dependent hemoglobin/transferrin/lactoferrin family receptor [Phyllobacterium sp. BT25]|uniref:TonB-dependent hemoglobin/transferrin/lactoferrin family receptor n=1 Tax=Phyllobacterium pellucidum TaxID=2740464 RepID=A0A849VTS3_9HYPH|nr:TonB-dependent hemoglobin/transferrin/lactoferrin family receptor [Phyllobacterium pellucidum]NTS33341.1 TonB-dependent hemoglobin/transferrin/lactoferrin family receptor [Phyllobacterium pellucidum]